MVLVANELPLYYKEINEAKRSCRFCIKPIQTIQPKADKRVDAINVQVVRGKSNTVIQLDEDEAKKVQQHGDYVARKIQRIHKSVIWNIMVGRSFADKIQRGKTAAEEVNIDHDENSEFEPTNPKTWSEESFDFIGTLLKASEFQYDGFVVLFCVCNDPKDASVDFDEIAWELEKCLTYHFVGTRSQMIMNEEACMSRKGLDPVSRKAKTPGKKKSGYCVYLAYQLLDSVTNDQMIGEAINKSTDVGMKKKQLLSALAEVKLLPQIDEKVRKQIKEIKEFMTKDQLKLVFKLRDVKEQESLQMLTEFLTFLKNGKDRSSGMMGLPQFLSFLNKSGDEPQQSGATRTSSRLSSVTSPRAAPRGSTLPRPTSGTAARKPSVSSQQTYSISSRSTTPDNSRKDGSNGNRTQQRRESSLASIASSGSASSTPETLRRQDQKASSKKATSATARPRSSATPKPAAVNAAGGKAKAAAAGPPPVPSRRTDSGSRSATPRVGSARSSVNGDASPRLTPSSSATNSPRMSSSTGARRGLRKPPADGKLITREDLRRMNKSYPSPGKATASSFSRTSIPMS